VDLGHVDAKDSEALVAEVVRATADATVVANNGVRDRETTREYLAYGADAVSVGRPSDDPAVLRRVRSAAEAWFGEAGSVDGPLGEGERGENEDAAPPDERQPEAEP
jgi:tRNA-dihydrouridine synthase